MLFPVKTNANKKAVVQYASVPLLNDKQIDKILKLTRGRNATK